LLEPSRDIGCIADHRVFHRQIISDRTEYDRPGVDANSHRQLRPIGVGRLNAFAERPLYRQGCQEGAAHMVFVRERRPEQGHEPVAGELRRCTPVALHLAKARFEE